MKADHDLLAERYARIQEHAADLQAQMQMLLRTLRAMRRGPR